MTEGSPPQSVFPVQFARLDSMPPESIGIMSMDSFFNDSGEK